MTEKNPTMADRLAQRLKSESELGMLFEENDLKEIVKTAVEKAFFEARSTGGYHNERKPPLIVEMAETAFRTSMQEYVSQVSQELVKMPKFQEMAAQYMIMSLPQLLRDSVNGMAFQTSQQVGVELEHRLKQDMANMMANLAAR